MFTRQKCIIHKEEINLQDDCNIISNEESLLHIDYTKINFLRIIEINDESVKLELSFYKFQQYTTRIIVINKDINILIKYFNKFNLYRLENYFINTSKIILVQESKVNEDKDVKLEFIFESGDCVELNTNYKRWDSWSNLRLK